MPLTREQICHNASEKLARAIPGLPSIRTLIGLDGFVDSIITVVNKRHTFNRFDPIRTIEDFGSKVLTAAGQSSNYELVVKQHKLGGNGPIMANALAQTGLDVNYLGALGYPSVHPVFDDFAKHAKLFSICDPGHTDALEFEDGKLMLGKYAQLSEVNWKNLLSRVGLAQLQQLANASNLIAMTNWTMLPFMTEVWEGLRSQVLPAITKRRRKFFVDLADPEKRTAEDLKRALSVLSGFQSQIDVMLGLNLKESNQVAVVLGIDVPRDSEAHMTQTAQRIREKLDIDCVVIHPRRGAAAALRDKVAEFAGPFVQQPMISTGAGDHFNAGFCLGRLLGMTLEESLCTGVAMSGYYVRSAQSPLAAKLGAFIRDLPPPQV